MVQSRGRKTQLHQLVCMTQSDCSVTESGFLLVRKVKDNYDNDMQVGCCRSQVCSCKSSRTSVSDLADITLSPSASLAIATMSVLDSGHSEKEKDIVNGSCDTHANCTMLSST